MKQNLFFLLSGLLSGLRSETISGVIVSGLVLILLGVPQLSFAGGRARGCFKGERTQPGVGFQGPSVLTVQSAASKETGQETEQETSARQKTSTIDHWNIEMLPAYGGIDLPYSKLIRKKKRRIEYLRSERTAKVTNDSGTFYLSPMPRDEGVVLDNLNENEILRFLPDKEYLVSWVGEEGKGIAIWNLNGKELHIFWKTNLNTISDFRTLISSHFDLEFENLEF